MTGENRALGSTFFSVSSVLSVSEVSRRVAHAPLQFNENPHFIRSDFQQLRVQSWR